MSRKHPLSDIERNDPELAVLLREKDRWHRMTEVKDAYGRCRPGMMDLYDKLIDKHRRISTLEQTCKELAEALKAYVKDPEDDTFDNAMDALSRAQRVIGEGVSDMSTKNQDHPNVRRSK